LLFVLVADLLQSLLNKAMRQELITKHIPCPACSDFHVIQYANDTLVIMKAYVANLICLKALLHTFAESTELKVNYHNSNKLNEDRVAHFTSTFEL
jgi:hypothetical protein